MAVEILGDSIQKKELLFTTSIFMTTLVILCLYSIKDFLEGQITTGVRITTAIHRRVGSIEEASYQNVH